VDTSPSVEKSGLMRRLMVELVLPEPLYQSLNRSEALRLGAGP
jgi:hypothetical protein